MSRTPKDSLLASRVISRFLAADEHEAMVFPTEEALDKYLKEHPRANGNNHSVKRPKHDDTASPADKAEVDGAARNALSRINALEHMLSVHNKGEDHNYASPMAEQMPRHMSDFKKDVDKMLGGINHIPAGKDRDRAKQIAHKLDEAFEEPNKLRGFRWNRTERAPTLPPEHLEKMLKTTAPLVKELDQLLTGQKMLMASRVLTRFLAADEHEAMEFPTPEARETYLKAHPKADKSKHTVKEKGTSKPAEKQQMPEGLTSAANVEAQHAKTRTEAITKLHESLKSLQEKAEDANTPAQKKFDQAYGKLYDMGDESSKAGKKLLEHISQYENYLDEGSPTLDAANLLHDALQGWERNRMDHFRVKGEFGYRFRGLQAEQTWAYAAKIDDQIDMLDRALKGEYD